MEENEKEITSPIKAIRAFCLQCSCGSSNEVKQCPCTKCALYPFRFGKNPYSHRVMTDEQKEAAAQRMKEYWENKKQEENENE